MSVPSAPLPYDPIDHVRTDGQALLAIVADHDLAVEVPSCPGWNLGELAWHVGGVWNTWGRVVAEQVTSVDTLRGWEQPERPADTLLLDWVTSAHTALLSALSRATPEQEVWTWTGSNQDVHWVRRRMAQETAVHRWDAAHAVGVPHDLATPLATDGIEEFLTWFAGRGVAEGTPALGGTVHLHCTDDQLPAHSGEWLVTALDASGVTFLREHAKGDVAVRGRASDLLLWLWGRDAGPVEMFGDADLAETFRRYGRR
ncbi:MAG TPA: maleylpyruvate isomerase family mycothiol-dependent enzyme [Ilumatobacteraceae bacterium]|nr:maleylpyruvate isomerase family mycothiol-dependent enzyme [Ilumatobacteraceae bacterium]